MFSGVLKTAIASPLSLFPFRSHAHPTLRISRQVAASAHSAFSASKRAPLARALEHYDYAGAIREARVALELASKAVLDKLDIDYFIESKGRRRFLHDVSDKIPEAFEKLKPYLKEDWEVDQARVSLARKQ